MKTKSHKTIDFKYRKAKLNLADGESTDCIITIGNEKEYSLIYTNSNINSNCVQCFDKVFKYTFFDKAGVMENPSSNGDLDFDSEDAKVLYKNTKFIYYFYYVFYTIDDIYPSNKLVDSISVNYSYLKDWLYKGDMVNIDIKENSITIESRKYSIKTPKYTVLFELKSDYPEYSVSNAEDIKIGFFSEVTFMYNEPVEFNKCLEDIEDLKRFLAFHFDSKVDVSGGIGEHSSVRFSINCPYFKNSVNKKHLNYYGFHKINYFPDENELGKMYNKYLEKCKDDDFASVFEIFSKLLVNAKDIPEVTFLLCMRCIEKIVASCVYEKGEIEKIIQENDLNGQSIGAITLSKIKENINHKSGKGYNWTKTKLYILLYMSMSDFKYDYFLQVILNFFKPKDILKSINYIWEYRNECAHISENKVPLPVKQYFDSVCYLLCKIMIGSELLGMDSQKLYKAYMFSLPRFDKTFDLEEYK